MAGAEAVARGRDVVVDAAAGVGAAGGRRRRRRRRRRPGDGGCGPRDGRAEIAASALDAGRPVQLQARPPHRRPAAATGHSQAAHAAHE